MNEPEFLRLIAQGENLHREFKETLPDNESLAKSLVSFANTDGGLLILGVSDCGIITGIDAPDRAINRIDDIAYNRCNPPVTVVQEIQTVDKKQIILVNIPRGSMRPYATQGGHYYIRSSSRSRKATREELLRLFQSSESLYYDEIPLGRSDINDIDRGAFSRFMETRLAINCNEYEIEHYLINMRCLDRQKRPTVAGMLFFGRKPQSFLPGARVVCAAIAGSDLSLPPFDRKEIDGTVPQQLEDAFRFINLHLLERHEIKALESETRHEIPSFIIREALVNALAHRDYTISAPVRIIAFSNRLEIRTPGTLPNTVTIESMKIGGAHVLRNPTIYNLFAKMGLVTDLGSGVRRIVMTMKEQFNRDVVLDSGEGEFLLAVPRESEQP